MVLALDVWPKTKALGGGLPPISWGKPRGKPQWGPKNPGATKIVLGLAKKVPFAVEPKGSL